VSITFFPKISINIQEILRLLSKKPVADEKKQFQTEHDLKL